MTRTGQLAESVTLQVKAMDAHGRRLGDWGSDIVRDARIVYLRGGETALQGRLQGQPIASITVRRDSSVDQVDTNWRATDREGRVFNITAVLPHEDRMFVDFTAVIDGSPGGA